ncbi:MAG TPA: GH92 family glycosyl hydrolase [Opitutaceae bacterium]|nr:GH92 family glycosyl hydrolase [Opitutaceae bacterium]
MKPAWATLRGRHGVALAWIVATAAAAAAPVDAVNVFTGTSNSRWMLFPGATLPFGLVKLSPDNQGNVWNGGYEYTVGSVSGFSHLHAFSLSGLSVMPVTGPIEYNPGMFRVFPGSPDGPFGKMWTSGYRSRIDKATERGAPGYYAVDLLDWRVKAELTATLRCGVMRLTYPATDEAHLLLDFAFPTEEQCRILEAGATLAGPNEITGHIRQANNYTGEYTVCFVLRTDRPLASLDAWQRDPSTDDSTNYGTDWRSPVHFQRGIRTFTGHDTCGLVLNFQTRAGEQIQVQTGLSLVSEAQARRNLETELKPFAWDFDRIARNARDAWARILGGIEVSGGTAEQRAMFYTCLYRAYSAKSVVSDADGTYVDMNRRIQKVADPAASIYSSDGLWGCQWTLFPLWTLTRPDVASAWVHFLLEAADRGGWIPEAPVNGGYSPVMVAQHQDALIVSSYQKGIRDFDAERAWRAIKHDLTTPGTPMPNQGYAGDRQLATYLAHGFVPDEDGPTSNTFEYAYDDWCAAQFARALGHEDDARVFLARSGSWRNSFDPETKYARRRHADGRWAESPDIFHYGTTGGWNGPGFVEGSAWIYTWFVPHDAAGLVAAIGRDEFNRRLEEGFAKGYVELSNEPNLQAPFLFNYSGQPWLTQRYTRQSLTEGYSTSPLRGWIGEEDEGQLSALYVLWALGLFEMNGGCAVRPTYDLSSPLFDRIVIHLDPHYYSGKDFVIEAHHNSTANVYIQSARLNGQPLRRAWLYHAEIVAGGRLEFEMGPAPNPEWGTGADAGPPPRE